MFYLSNDEHWIGLVWIVLCLCMVITLSSGHGGRWFFDAIMNEFESRDRYDLALSALA